MADDKKRTAAAAGLGITVGAILALLASRKIKAAPEADMIVGLDEPAMQALLGLLEHADATLGIDTEVAEHLIEVSNAINNLAVSLGVAVPKLDNPPEITAFTVFTTGLTNPIQLPSRIVPYDKELVIKALHINTGVILVAPSRAAAMNLNSSYWLIANEAIEYKIKNADHIWISCHPTLGIVGDGVVCTMEQEATH